MKRPDKFDAASVISGGIVGAILGLSKIEPMTRLLILMLSAVIMAMIAEFLRAKREG